jgi:hypothetical protein
LYGALVAGATVQRPSDVSAVADVYAVAVPPMKNSSCS